jgi:hypothetical protein
VYIRVQSRNMKIKIKKTKFNIKFFFFRYFKKKKKIEISEKEKFNIKFGCKNNIICLVSKIKFFKNVYSNFMSDLNYVKMR